MDQDETKNIEDTPDEATAEETPVESAPKVQDASDANPVQPVIEEKVKSTPIKSGPTAPDSAKWYIVHTYAGHENKVARSLHQRVETMGFENRVFDVIVPTRKTIKIVNGKKQNVDEKIFPGYVLVRMILDEESWLLVRTTQGVTAFIGPGSKPTPISDKEVAAIQKFMSSEEPLYTAALTVGDVVKINDGPFTDFEGTVNDIDQQRGKVKVTVMMFGRETPVELDFLQVKKI